jgi:hypothetical protein
MSCVMVYCLSGLEADVTFGKNTLYVGSSTFMVEKFFEEVDSLIQKSNILSGKIVESNKYFRGFDAQTSVRGVVVSKNETILRGQTADILIAQDLKDFSTEVIVALRLINEDIYWNYVD